MIHKNFASTAYDRAKVETLTKELTAVKLDLDDAKERNIHLATKLKDIEIQYATTVRSEQFFNYLSNMNTSDL